MAIIGQTTKTRQMKWVIYMTMIAVFAVWHYYDGWVNPIYKTAEKHGDMLYNRTVTIALAVLFIVFLIAFIRILKSRTVVDEQGIHINDKRTIDWKSMVRIDDSKVEKGLLTIVYQKDGHESRFLLDDYKVDHFEEMLDEISIHRPDLLTPAEESVDQSTK
jgi:hypothetical protein